MSETIKSIIDFYKQANNNVEVSLSATNIAENISNNSVVLTEPQPTSKESEKDFFVDFVTTVKGAIIEAKKVKTISENLSSTIIAETQTASRISENVQPNFIEKIEEDPFKSFIDKFKNIINKAKETEPAAIIEKEIKTKTLEFITKLKEGSSAKKPLPKKLNKQYPEKYSKKYKQAAIKNEEITETLDSKKEEIYENINQEEIPTLEIENKAETNFLSQQETPNPLLIKNSYVEQLRALEKDKKKTETKPTDIKSLIDKKVKEAVEVLHKQLMNTAMGGSGGGTNAVQFAEGGTMRGDLNVTGNYLSGGVDLKDIFSGGGGGPIDRLTAGSKLLLLNPDGTFSFPDDLIKTENDSSLTLQSENTTLSAFTQVVVSPYAFIVHDNNQNSISFDTIDNTVTITTDGIYEWKFNDQGDLVGPGGVLTVEGSLNVSSHLLSGGRNLDEIFLTSETDAQTLSWNASAYNLSISNGNSVSLSSIKGREDINTLVSTNSAAWDQSYNTATVYQANSASYATTQYTDATYLTLSGGTLTNSLSVFGSTFINNNLTVGGSLTALGTATFANTLFTTTSAVSVVNTGPGPALYVYQASGPYDVASFYDGDGIEVLHVGNAGPGGLGKVGINESFPNEELTVRGSISATETIYANSYLSAGVNLLDIFSGGGGGATPIKRFDYVTVSNVDYSYSGSALFETPDTSPTWKLIRLTYANNGTISNSASAIDSWTGRLTAVYI